MLILLLACSGSAEPDDAHEHLHDHNPGQPHGRDLRDQASRVFAATSDAPFDRWLDGDDDALTEQQKTGLKSFMTAGCAHCHAGADFANDDVPSLRTATTWPDHAGDDADIRAFLGAIHPVGP